MAALTKQQILDADDRPSEKVEVPEWGGAVWVRTISSTERDTFEATITRSGKADVSNIRARLAALTVVDDKGERLFADSDMEALGEKSGSAMDRVWTVTQRLNGLTNRDVEKLKHDQEQTASQE